MSTARPLRGVQERAVAECVTPLGLRGVVVKEDKHWWGRVGVEAPDHEVENGGHLLARDIELLDDLVDAQILNVLD